MSKEDWHQIPSVGDIFTSKTSKKTYKISRKDHKFAYYNHEDGAERTFTEFRSDGTCNADRGSWDLSPANPPPSTQPQSPPVLAVAITDFLCKKEYYGISCDCGKCKKT